MKRPFLSGDRIAIYSGTGRAVGIVQKVDGDTLVVDPLIAKPGLVYAHVKQCRRLVKKKRREIWINWDISLFTHGHVNGQTSVTDKHDAGITNWNGEVSSIPRSGWFHFIEAKKK